MGQLDECYVTLLSEYSDLNNSLMEAMKIFPILLHGNPCVQSVLMVSSFFFYNNNVHSKIAKGKVTVTI